MFFAYGLFRSLREDVTGELGIEAGLVRWNRPRNTRFTDTTLFGEQSFNLPIATISQDYVIGPSTARQTSLPRPIRRSTPQRPTQVG